MPQGSILGPTLLLLFINDLPLHLNHCLADLYADDNTIHASRKNKPEIEHKLQSDANETEVWSINNKLPIHYGKSTTMTLGTMHKIQQAEQLNISIGNTQLNPVSSQKLPGVHIGFGAQLIGPIQLHVKWQNSSICKFFQDIAWTFFCL